MEEKIKPIKWNDFYYAMQSMIKNTLFARTVDILGDVNYEGYIHGLQIYFDIDSDVGGYLAVWLYERDMHTGIGKKYLSTKLNQKYDPHRHNNKGMIKQLWMEYRTIISLINEVTDYNQLTAKPSSLSLVYDEYVSGSDDGISTYIKTETLEYWKSYILDFNVILNKYILEKKLTEQYVDSYVQEQEEVVIKI